VRRYKRAEYAMDLRLCLTQAKLVLAKEKPSAYPTLRERKLGYLQRSGHVLSTVACMVITFIQCNINYNNIQSACT